MTLWTCLAIFKNVLQKNQIMLDKSEIEKCPATRKCHDVCILYSIKLFKVENAPFLNWCFVIFTAAPAGRFVKDDGTRPIKDGTLMDVEEDMEKVCNGSI